MSPLNIVNLSKKFSTINRQVTALSSITLAVEEKEFFVLLGPSGCGKSTLLNLIAGLEQPTGGEISLGATIFSSPAKKIHIAPRDRNIAMVFQNYALYPHMSVAENIEFPLKIRGISKDKRVAMVLEAAQMLELDKVLQAKPGELSGGQRQRVAIARAIVRKPSLFLLDEPLSNLDAKLRASTRNNLKLLQKRLGITTIYVTHDQVEAMTLGDRIALLNNGLIEQIGTPQELYNNPVNHFVATFIGSPPMNLFTVNVTFNNNQFGFILNGSKIELPDSLVKQISQTTQTISLGVRPENIEIKPEPSKDSIEVAVTGIERLGRETIIYADCESVSISLISSSLVPQIGEKINIVLDMSRAHVFEKTKSDVN